MTAEHTGGKLAWRRTAEESAKPGGDNRCLLCRRRRTREAAGYPKPYRALLSQVRAAATEGGGRLLRRCFPR